MPLVIKSQLSFYQKKKNFARNWFILLIAKTGHRQNVLACIDHFHDKFIQHGKSRCKLNWELHPVPTIHPCVNSQPSLINTPKVPRPSPRKRALPEPDEFYVFTNRDKVKDFTSFTSEHTPFCYDFKRFDGRVQYYNSRFDTEIGARMYASI